MTEIDGVEIRLNYLFLAEVFLKPARVIHLQELSPDTSYTLDIGKINISGELLCDGAGAADAAAAGQGGDDGTYHSGPVESVVLPEGLIFDGNERVDEIFRHVLVFDDLAVFSIEDVVYLFSLVVVYDRSGSYLGIDILVIVFRSRRNDGACIDDTGQNADGA